MKAVFADTFYWIAPTLPGDPAYTRAQQVTDDVVTTEEVLTEYLTFFCDAPEYMRREVAANVEAMLIDPGFGSFRKAMIPLFRDLSCTAHALIRATA